MRAKAPGATPFHGTPPEKRRRQIREGERKSPAQNFDIFVKTMSNRHTMTFHVDPCDTIARLKGMISDREGIPCDQMMLVLCGLPVGAVTIPSNCTVCGNSGYVIPECGALLHLKLRKSGVPERVASNWLPDGLWKECTKCSRSADFRLVSEYGIEKEGTVQLLPRIGGCVMRDYKCMF